MLWKLPFATKAFFLYLSTEGLSHRKFTFFEICFRVFMDMRGLSSEGFKITCSVKFILGASEPANTNDITISRSTGDVIVAMTRPNCVSKVSRGRAKV